MRLQCPIISGIRGLRTAAYNWTRHNIKLEDRCTRLVGVWKLTPIIGVADNQYEDNQSEYNRIFFVVLVHCVQTVGSYIAMGLHGLKIVMFIGITINDTNCL